VNTKDQRFSILSGAAVSRAAWLLVASSLALTGCDGAEDPAELDSLRDGTRTEVPAIPGEVDVPVEERTGRFVCPLRYTPQSELATPLPFPYCATADLEDDEEYPFDDVTRLVISQHGLGSDAGMYFERLNDGAEALASELRGATFVLAPQFFDMNPIDNNRVQPWELDELLWWEDGRWPNGLESNGHAGEQFSSYTILDELVGEAVSKMPNLRELIFVGQSGGGQTVQKYAALGNAEYPDVKVSYFVANPFVYAYVDDQRPTFEFGQSSPYDHVFATPDPDSPFPWESTLVCPALLAPPDPNNPQWWGGSDPEGLPPRHDYNEWAFGLEDAPAYSGVLDEAQQQLVRERYLDRDVTYLIGEDDMFIDTNMCTRNTQIQGKHRRRRAEAYAAHVQQLGADHELVKVPDRGHGSRMFEDDCVRRVVFGLADDCQAMEDQRALTNWGGEVVGVVAFETNDGDDLPEVLVAHRSGNVDRLYLVDDVEHGFGFIANVTPAWGNGARVTGLEVANMDGDNAKEVVVGVTGGDGGWYLLGHSNGDVVELEAGGQGQDVAALTTAAISNHKGSEIVVAWDATQGERWRAFAWSGGSHIPTSSGTYGSAARPVAIAVDNVVYGAAKEVVIALDSTSGPRIVLADLLGNSMLVDPGWDEGRRIVDADTSWQLGRAGQSTRELVLATAGGDRPWVVLEEDPNAPGVLIQVLESPDTWEQGVEPTSITVRVPFREKSTVAVGRTGPTDGHAVLYTYKRDEVDGEDIALLGDVRVEARGLSESAELPRIEFADLDDRGGAYAHKEVLIGRGGDLGFGYRLRVLSAL